MDPLIVATDFSGLGSPEEALKRLQVNHRVTFACDKDKYVKQSYLANHTPDMFYDDIIERNHAKAPGSDLYIFGFPCQAFSLAGNRKGFEDTRGTLVYNSAEYIRTHRPRVFTGENVKGLLSHDKIKGSKSKYGRTFGVIRDLFGATVNGQQNLYKYDDCLNYHIFFQVLNTKDYTVPQNRERVFIVGFRDEADAIKFSMPKKLPLIKRLKDILEDNVAEKYYLSEKMINYLITRKDNFNNGKINFKTGDDIGTCDTSSQKSLDISDNIILEKQNKGNRTRIVSPTSPTSPTIQANQAKQSTDSVYVLEKNKQVIIDNDNGQIKQVDNFTCLDANYHKGMDNHAQRSFILEQDSSIIFDKDNTAKGYAEAVKGDSINLSNPNSNTRRGRVGKQIANTLDTACNQAVVIQLNPPKESGGVQPYQQNRLYDEIGIAPALSAEAAHTTNILNNYRIRKLTPKECFRLQGYSDEFFEKCASINSDTQLYKQAGNSITVDTIMHLLIQIPNYINKRETA